MKPICHPRKNRSCNGDFCSLALAFFFTAKNSKWTCSGLTKSFATWTRELKIVHWIDHFQHFRPHNIASEGTTGTSTHFESGRCLDFIKIQVDHLEFLMVNRTILRICSFCVGCKFQQVENFSEHLGVCVVSFSKLSLFFCVTTFAVVLNTEPLTEEFHAIILLKLSTHSVQLNSQKSLRLHQISCQVIGNVGLYWTADWFDILKFWDHSLISLRFATWICWKSPWTDSPAIPAEKLHSCLNCALSSILLFPVKHIWKLLDALSLFLDHAFLLEVNRVPNVLLTPALPDFLRILKAKLIVQIRSVSLRQSFHFLPWTARFASISRSFRTSLMFCEISLTFGIQFSGWLFVWRHHCTWSEKWWIWHGISSVRVINSWWVCTCFSPACTAANPNHIILKTVTSESAGVVAMSSPGIVSRNSAWSLFEGYRRDLWAVHFSEIVGLKNLQRGFVRQHGQTVLQGADHRVNLHVKGTTRKVWEWKVQNEVEEGWLCLRTWRAKNGWLLKGHRNCHGSPRVWASSHTHEKILWVLGSSDFSQLPLFTRGGRLWFFFPHDL